MLPGRPGNFAGVLRVLPNGPEEEGWLREVTVQPGVHQRAAGKSPESLRRAAVVLGAGVEDEASRQACDIKRVVGLLKNVAALGFCV